MSQGNGGRGGKGGDAKVVGGGIGIGGPGGHGGRFAVEMAKASKSLEMNIVLAAREGQ